MLQNAERSFLCLGMLNSSFNVYWQIISQGWQNIFKTKQSWIGFWLTCHCRPFLNLFLWTKCENCNLSLFKNVITVLIFYVVTIQITRERGWLLQSHILTVNFKCNGCRIFSQSSNQIKEQGPHPSSGISDLLISSPD